MGATMGMGFLDTCCQEEQSFYYNHHHKEAWQWTLVFLEVCCLQVLVFLDICHHEKE
jgi:hypothetical protein